MYKIICHQISKGSICMTFMSTKMRQDNTRDVMVHKARSLIEVDQFQKVYLSQSTDDLVLRYAKESRRTVEKFEF